MDIPESLLEDTLRVSKERYAKEIELAETQKESMKIMKEKNKIAKSEIVELQWECRQKTLANKTAQEDFARRMAEAELKQAKRMKEGVDELSESNERKRKIYEKNIADHQEYQVTTQKKINIMEKDKKDLVKELDMEKSELERNREAKERMDRETERYNKASRWITYQLTYGKQCEECSEKTNGLLPDAVYEVKDQSTSDQPK